MGYEWVIIEKMTDEDIWKWITYIDVINWDEIWKIKSFNNDTKTAFVVFNANQNWDWNHWKDYTAQGCKYSDLEF